MGMLLAVAVLTATGCAFVGPSAAPSEPFGDFSVGEFGGIDGRQNILYVRADGTALLISRTPAAGRLSDQDVGRLKILLTSRQFRQEVEREAERKAKSPAPVCTDQITTDVTMGSLWMNRTDPCGTQAAPAPAFEEIISIVAPAMQGNFDGPVNTTEPRLLPMRLVRLLVQDQPPYTIKIDAAGRAMITIAGRTPEVHDLSIQQRDTVRLLLARLVETPVVSCTSPVHYQLQIDTGPNIPGPNIPGPKSPGPEISGPDCGFPQRQPEFHALTVLLENAFGV
ncbi:MAG TPA: hypothetical protein VNC13_13235 [Propionibacteriaceae bacterium]|jgi:hypothetical protein|nr:hypothetical protein [Propionibacteriaceae bacterium]